MAHRVPWGRGDVKATGSAPRFQVVLYDQIIKGRMLQLRWAGYAHRPYSDSPSGQGAQRHPAASVESRAWSLWFCRPPMSGCKAHCLLRLGPETTGLAGRATNGHP